MKRGTAYSEISHPKGFFRRKKSGPEILAAIDHALSTKKNKANRLKEIPPVQVNDTGIGTWTVDKDNSSLEFSVMHLKLANIGGRFNDFSLKVNSSAEDFSDATIELTVRVDSIDTGNAVRDKVLKGEEWLNAQKFPVISFNGTSFKKIQGNKYELTGNLTIGDISHTVIFDATLNGMFTNTWPKKTLCGFSISGILSRDKFKLGNAPGATGAGDEIAVGANVELIKG